MNHFSGFKLYIEEEEKPDNFVSTVKKQLDVPKQIWLGLPIMLSNVKLGKQKITSPTMFYVRDFDDVSVTLSSIPNPGHEHDGDIDYDDPDHEIDMDKNNIQGDFEITISRDDFYKLQEPQLSPGMDTGMMGGF